MVPVNRRSFLGGALAMTVIGSGCLVGAPTPIRTADIQVGPRTTIPDWSRDDDPDIGFVEIIESADHGRTVLPLDDIPADRRDRVMTFLEETEFAHATVVFVETQGPNSCYDRIDFTDVRIRDDEIRALATARDTSEPDEACLQVITAPSALLRVVRDDPPPPRRIRFRVINGWGASQEFRVP